MRIRLMSHIFVFFMVVLTFSIPFVTLAQQNSVQREAENAAVQDMEAVRLEAKTAAERDASSDINEHLWFGIGVGICCISVSVCGFAGCLVGESIDPSTVSADADIGGILAVDPTQWGESPGCSFNINTSTGARVGTVVGSAVGVLVPLIGIYNHQSHPLPERLIGKSPEYVAFYTDVYKAKTRSLRTTSAVKGAAIGYGLLMLNLLTSE